MAPPRLKERVKSKVGTLMASRALVERATRKREKSAGETPATQRTPLAVTSMVPQMGVVGIVTGTEKVVPPLVERLKMLVPQHPPAVLQAW